MKGFLLLVVVLGVATVVGVLWRARSGTLRPASGRSAATSSAVASWNDLGVTLGERATLVQFSSAFCQPCRATRRLLTEVAELVPGVTYVEIDAETHLDEVRALNVLKTPTTFVLDRQGHVVRRASGQPRKADVIAAVGVAVDATAVPDPR